MDNINNKCITVDKMSGNDVRNGYYMRDIIGYENYKIDRLIQVSMRDVFLYGFSSFKLYRDEELYDKINGSDYNIRYVADGFTPFHFGVQTKYEDNNDVVTTIVYPKLQDKASYVFFGSKLNHALKDVNSNEVRVRDRVGEVIPMFYEMLCADEEIDKDVSVEVLKRRLILIQLDENEETLDESSQLQLFNSYYYALALFNKYKNENDKISLLQQVSKVLKGKINTLELLKMLNIYDNNMDYTVSCELDVIKEYIHSR